MATADRASLFDAVSQDCELPLDGLGGDGREGTFLCADLQLGEVKGQFSHRREGSRAKWCALESGDPLGGAAQDREVARLQPHTIKEIRPARLATGCLEIGEIEVAGLEAPQRLAGR